MAKASIRRFDVQAKWSLWLSVASVMTCMGMLVLLARNWEGHIRLITFNSQGMFQPIYLGATGLTMLLSTFGLALGFNSAGQRRNDRQKLSWTGFFIGLGVLALACVSLAAFLILKQPMSV